MKKVLIYIIFRTYTYNFSYILQVKINYYFSIIHKSSILNFKSLSFNVFVFGPIVNTYFLLSYM